jgi:ABC-type phosphate/phosphonate transport system permease subunit
MDKFHVAHDAIWDANIQAVQMTIDQLNGYLTYRFGKDYCRKHPEVLAAMVQSTMTAFAGSLIAAAIQDLQEKL